MLCRPAVIMFASLLLSPIAAEKLDREPFGRRATPVTQRSVQAKWDGVEADIRADRQVLQACVTDRTGCPAAATRFLAIIDDARARRGLDKYDAVNRAVNTAIGIKTDMEQHGVDDLWSSPLATFQSGFGDCEDLAIAKYVALGEAGTAPDDLRLVIVPQRSREFHVVLAARLDHHWMILDIPHNDIIEDTATGYVPRFIIDHRGIREIRLPDRPVADASTTEWPGTATTCG